MGPGGVRLRVDIRGRIRWIPRVRRGAPSRQPRRPVDGGFTPGPDQWPPPHRTRALVRVLPHSRQRRSVAFAVGAGSLLTIPALLLTLCLLLATGIPAGFIIALGVRNAGVRSRLLSRLRTLFLVLLGIGYFALIFTNAFASALEPIYRVLSPTPIDWFGDLAALGLGVGASPFRAIGAVGFTGVFVVVAVVSLYRLSEWLWYADGVHITHEVERSDDRSSRFNGLSRILSQPVFGVVVADWKRARRSPISLSFALYPLIVLAGPIVTAVQTGEIGTGLPLWVLLTGTWVAGSLFALNVVGQEGAALLSHCSQRPRALTGHRTRPLWCPPDSPDNRRSDRHRGNSESAFGTSRCEPRRVSARLVGRIGSDRDRNRCRPSAF